MYRVTVGPTVEPVSAAEAKTHLRVSHNADDTLIGALLVAAREYCELVTGAAFTSRTGELVLDTFPLVPIWLPFGPIQSITSIKYTNSAGVEATVSSSIYYVTPSGQLCRQYGLQWPTAILRPKDAVTVTYKSGYGDLASTVPQRIKQAILLLAGHWYEHRESVAATGVRGTEYQKVPQTVDDLLRLERRVIV